MRHRARIRQQLGAHHRRLRGVCAVQGGVSPRGTVPVAVSGAHAVRGGRGRSQRHGGAQPQQGIRQADDVPGASRGGQHREVALRSRRAGAGETRQTATTTRRRTRGGRSVATRARAPIVERAPRAAGGGSAGVGGPGADGGGARATGAATTEEASDGRGRAGDGAAGGRGDARRRRRRRRRDGSRAAGSRPRAGTTPATRRATRRAAPTAAAAAAAAAVSDAAAAADADAAAGAARGGGGG